MPGISRNKRDLRVLVHFDGVYLNVADTLGFYEMCDYAREVVDESCGVVSEDFPEHVASLVKLLLCYKKTQFYIHVDSLNNNSARVSSRKQYLMIKTMEKKYSKQSSTLDDFICRHSQSASLVRLIKEAIKYNPYAKFLKVLSCEQIEWLAKEIMKSICSSYIITDYDIQSCYQYGFGRSSIGSGERYATSSCMVGKEVGKFYDMFNVKGKLIRDKDGNFIGRYLEWKMDNGKTYVDRLYVIGENVQPALGAVDNLYKGRTDVEFYPNKPSGCVDLKPSYSREDFKKYLYLPYVDTFYNFCTNGDKVFLQRDMVRPYDEGVQVRSTHYYTSDMFSYTCPVCGEQFMTKTGLRFHRMFEIKSKSGKAFEANKKIKEIINKYFAEAR